MKKKGAENIQKIKADMERFKYEAAQEHGISFRRDTEKKENK